MERLAGFNKEQVLEQMDGVLRLRFESMEEYYGYIDQEISWVVNDVVLECIVEGDRAGGYVLKLMGENEVCELSIDFETQQTPFDFILGRLGVANKLNPEVKRKAFNLVAKARSELNRQSRKMKIPNRSIDLPVTSSQIPELKVPVATENKSSWGETTVVEKEVVVPVREVADRKKKIIRVPVPKTRKSEKDLQSVYQVLESIDVVFGLPFGGTLSLMAWFFSEMGMIDVSTTEILSPAVVAVVVVALRRLLYPMLKNRSRD